jgi:xylulokinase
MTSGGDYILAIDLGSSGPKVSLVSQSGDVLASTSGRTATFTTPDGGSEQDPEEWWQAITACVHRLLGERIAPVERIVAVSCASQWSVTVPVDAQGRHLMNAVHWSDMRGAVHTRRITDGLIKVSGYGLPRLIRWVRSTGGVPTKSGADALAHILFIKHERPEIYRQTYKFLEPMDYLNFRLSGRAVATYATIFPYLLTDNRDNTRVRYDERLIAWSGLDRDKLPDLVPVAQVLGPILPEMADAWGLSRATVVIAGTPDSQAAAIGSGAERDYEGHVCLGTTAWLSCHVPFKKTNVVNNLATMPSAMHGRNMVVAEQGAAGKCLQVFIENWLCRRDALDQSGPPTDVYERVEALAATAPPGCEGLLFLPWLNGAGPPSGEGTMRGGFLNQSLVSNRAHALRAIMEGVAMNLRWLRGSVESFVGREFDGLNFIGGGARSELWSQTLADVLDCTVRRMAQPEMAISRGAAMVAWVALGRTTVEQLPALTRVDRTFLPDPGRRTLYKELFAEFLSSYKANRRLFRRLNAR